MFPCIILYFIHPSSGAVPIKPMYNIFSYYWSFFLLPNLLAYFLVYRRIITIKYIEGAV